MADWQRQDDVQVGWHGRRRGGIDINDYVATKGKLVNTVAATTSSIGNEQEGTIVLSSKVSAATLHAPRKGLRRYICAITGSTAARVLTLASGAFETTSISTAGNRYTKATFNARADFLDLLGVSTALWFVREQVGITFSTS